ncbi:PQQ-dependent sugar dehydrogenase [Micromonospora sp. DT81.3]|uniref:PQQ-dependent sugar dehydrogenase n=1 Tax=Micromonospora sp. DT81.3 TaxID=3416523 RepID=UPI003CF3B123
MNWTVMRVPAILLAALLVVSAAVPADAPPAAARATASAAVATPAGFSTSVVGAVVAPTALAPLPDGRLLVASQRGPVYSISGGVVAPTPVLDLSAKICANSERGVLGLAADPDPTTRAVFVFYTRKGSDAACPTNASGTVLPAGAPTNRVSRFVMRADGTIDPATESVLIDGILSPAGNHNAGDLFVGKDGNLYVSTGDGGCDYRGGVADPGGSGCGGANDASRDPNILNGKILRITRAGAVPADNPFRGDNSASCARGPAPAGMVCQETFASGLRNPYRIAADPNASGTVFRINDVGQNAWEEIDQGIKGSDYGWNMREGRCARTGAESDCGAPAPSGLTDPVYAYGHSTGCRSITGGAYVPNGIWPAAHTGSYLFADYVCGKIRSLSPAGTATDLVTGLGVGSAVALAFARDGATTSLYYTSYAGGGTVHKLRYTGTANRAPTAVVTGTPSSGAAPLNVTLSGSGSTDPDGDALTYIWAFGDGTTGLTTTTPSTTHSFRAGTWTTTLRVRDAKGAVSPAATVTISSGNHAPRPVIAAPAVGATFVVGSTYTVSGSATDAEDGTLAASRLTWTIERRHGGHTHPFLGPVTGATATFVAPGPEDLAAAATSDLRVILKATDSKGLSTTTTRTFAPQRVNVTFATTPTGRTVLVGGTPYSGPTTLSSWAGALLQVRVPTQSTADGTAYEFASWSDGGAASHTITTPPVATTYTATLRLRPAPPGPVASIVAAQTGQDAATLRWMPPAITGGAPLSGYRVSRDGTDTAGAGPWSYTVPATTTSFTFAKLVPASLYTLSVQPISSAGAGPASSATVRTVAGTLAGPPTSVTATTPVVAGATLSWLPPSTTGGQPITGYRVARDGTDLDGGGPWSTTLLPTARTFAFTRLVAGRTYTLTVSAITAVGIGTAAPSQVVAR